MRNPQTNTITKQYKLSLKGEEMKTLTIFFVLITVAAFSQVTIVSTNPANNAVNVPLSTTISITFSTAVDTNAFNTQEWVFINVDVGQSYFNSGGTVLSAPVTLQPNTAYFIAVYYAKGMNGSVMTQPYVVHFTTGSSFPLNSVSGTISSGSTGVIPANSIVALMNKPIDQSENGPDFSAWGTVNIDGSYTIPYVANGTYWPLAAKDADNDGEINPEGGSDVIAIGDSIIVNNASLTNVNLSFFKISPYTFAEARTIADSLAMNLPSDRQLKRINGWDMDTTGKSQSWEFAYTTNGNTTGYTIRVSSFSSNTEPMDPGYFNWMKDLRTLPNSSSAASSVTVMANVEAAGGKQVRLQPHSDTLEFRMEASLADQNNSEFSNLVPDMNQFYWGVSYSLQYQKEPNRSEQVSGMRYLCDFSTGAVINSGPILFVNESNEGPVAFGLSQNYPNPFNPATKINFNLPSSEFTTLKIYTLLGQEVATLISERKDAGEYTVHFDGHNVPSGIYFYQLRSGNYIETKKMALIK